MELPDAKKWFTGFFDITRWIKDGGTLIRLLLIAAAIWLLALGAGRIKQLFFTPPAPPQIQGVSGGKVSVDNSQQKVKNKIGVFNLW